VSRKRATTNFEARLLAEVDNLCPMCGKSLLGEKNGKSVKYYDIAHIYPHSPTDKQRELFKDVPKCIDAESFENLIALCKPCHVKQDFHTTVNDYIKLYQMKQKYMRNSQAIEAASAVPIEDQIKDVLLKLQNVDCVTIMPLSYHPVVVENKITYENILLMNNVKGMVVQYFLLVQELFRQLDMMEKNITS